MISINKTLDDCKNLKEFKQSALEDVIYFEDNQVKEENDYISHISYMIIKSKIDYIKEKFEITNNDIREYRSQTLQTY